MFRSREMIAVEEADAVARQQRRQRGPQRPDGGSDALGRILHQGRGHRQFDVLQLIVNGLIADGELVFERAVGSMHRGLLVQHDAQHQVDEGGEEQFVGVLTLGGTGEQLVDALGIEEALEYSPGHHTDWLLLDERREHLVQQHLRFPPCRSLRPVYEGIADMDRRLPWKPWG